jgi:hypothetical protein
MPVRVVLQPAASPSSLDQFGLGGALWSPLRNAAPVASLTPHDLVAFLEGTFPFAVLAPLLLFFGRLGHAFLGNGTLKMGP